MKQNELVEKRKSPVLGRKLQLYALGWLIAACGFSASSSIDQEPVRFADNDLKKAVEYRLKMKDPTPQDMLSLEYLNLHSRQIRAFEGIQYAQNVTFVLISYNREIEDLSALSLLGKLKKLKIHDCKLNDISLSFISEMRQLEELDLSGNQITNLEPLSSLTTLKTLDLAGNQITNVEPLSSLTTLKRLGLENNNISDVTPLKNLKNLKSLNLRSNSISDISPLASLPPSCRIGLKYNPIQVRRFSTALITAILIFVAGIIALIMYDRNKTPKVPPTVTLSLICGTTAVMTILFFNYLFYHVSRDIGVKVAHPTRIIEVVLLLAGEILAILSLVRIRLSKEDLKGKWRAWIGVFIPIVTVICYLIDKLLNEWAGNMMAC